MSEMPYPNRTGSKLRSALTLFGQRAMMTADLFGRNEMANHASAGAYGFLLSTAPAVLIAAFILARALRTSPEGAARMLDSLMMLGTAFNAREIAVGFLTTPLAGFSGFIALANLVWTARVFALSLQRGIRVVFADPPGGAPIRQQLMTFAVEGAAVLYLLAFVLSSRFLASLIRDAEAAGMGATGSAAANAATALLQILETTLVVYFAYRMLPKVKPGRKAAFQGAVFCAAAFAVASFAFRSIVNLSRYDIVYGVLGGLIVALANVYFFFMFFFLGAQLAFVTDSFDSLVFSRLRRIKSGVDASSLEHRLFSAPERLIAKYARSYNAGQRLFEKGDRGKDVFFVLDGEVSISLAENPHAPALATIQKGGFFGEMAYLLSEARTAYATAHTDATILVLPPVLFDRLLRDDNLTSRQVIDSLSMRLKGMNERLGPSSETAPISDGLKD